MKRHALRNLLEYALARPLLFVVRWMPASWMPGMAARIGGLLNVVLAKRRRVVESNCAIAFGERDAPKARTLAKASFRNISLAYMEVMRGPGDPQRFFERFDWADESDRERVERASAGGPVIVAASHIGAYELGGYWAARTFEPLCALVRPLDNPLLENLMLSKRKRFGRTFTRNRGGVRVLSRQLRNGGSVVVFADINMRGPKRMFVDFFGRPAATATTIPRLARRHRVPVLPVFVLRASDPRKLVVEIGRAVESDPASPPEEDARRILQSVTTDIEDRVRRHPEQWLWTHRRWKTRPAEETS